jgi:predicted double-glycine peptidase
MRLPLFCLATVLGCLLFSCTTTLHYAAAPQNAIIIHGVPFFQQEDYQCGPAALATVINFWYVRGNTGRRLSLEEAVARTYSPSARGVLGIDLEVYAKKLGFEAAGKATGIDDLRRAVLDEMPVIILVDYGFSIYQRNHFMVVTGFGPDFVIVNSGRREREIISNEDLGKIWKKTGYWSLVIKPSS